MLNFIKSEYYRMIHTTGIRVFFGILSVLTILLISGISIVETQYHTTSFSYSILVSSPMFFTLMGMLTASVLYEDSKRNGIIKNSIANGIPRGKVFFSQCIVSITCLDGIGKITIDGVEYLLHEGESIVMPAGHPHAVYGQEAFKMLLVVVF